MKDNEKIYTFSVSRGGQGPIETYDKKESELTQGEINLLAGEILNEIDNTPPKVKELIYWSIYKQTQKK